VPEPPNDIDVPLTVNELLASLACASVPELMLLALRLVRLEPLPIIILPVMFPLVSRTTTVFAVAAVAVS